MAMIRANGRDRYVGQGRATLIDEVRTSAGYGALGDGSTDDRAALQLAIDDTPVGGTLYLESGKTYYLVHALIINKPMTLNLGGSTLLKNNDGTLNVNVPLKVETDLGSGDSWSETIGIGAETLSVGSAIAALLSAGSVIYLELGTNAIDSAQPDWIGFATVVSKTSMTITVDRVVPYDINGTGHNLFIPTQVAENIVIENGALEEVELEAVANGAGLWLKNCRKIKVSQIRIYGGSILLDCVEDVDGKLISIRNQFESQTGIGGWHIHNCSFDAVRWSCGTKGSGVRQFLSVEDRTHGLYFGTVDLDLGDGRNGRLFKRETCASFEKLRMNGTAIYDNPGTGGGGGGDIGIQELQIFGNVASIDFYKARRVYINSVRLGDPLLWTKNIPIVGNLDGSGTPKYYQLPQGLYRRMWVRANGTTSGMDIYFATGDGVHSVNIKSILVNGTFIMIPWGSSSGSALGGGDVNNIALYTRRFEGLATTGTSIDVIIDYFPDLSAEPSM